ncbi:MAG: polyphosphate kinase 2 family protein [Bacteroidetes bacterium]|nr:polyphosphate kinase 2 family protein [Bacteroidota bacterium]
MTSSKIISALKISDGIKINLKNFDTGLGFTDELKEFKKSELKDRAKEILERNIEELASMQELLYASDNYGLLIILQAMDAAGKDGIIKHVMKGINPQGCQVYSFKQPSAEELDHTFLWRCMKTLPERGRIGIFNRSYYEDVLVVKVHPEILSKEQLPQKSYDESFWKRRYEDINAFERHLVRNGTIVLKFFLHVSKKEQKQRFLQRLEDPNKLWKFSAADITERAFWDDYMKAYEEAISNTSTKWAPWYVIPADFKWASRTLVSDIIVSTIKSLDLSYPVPSKEKLKALEDERQKLLNGQ